MAAIPHSALLRWKLRAACHRGALKREVGGAAVELVCPTPPLLAPSLARGPAEATWLLAGLSCSFKQQP